MPETVKIAEYIPPQQTRSGKWTPHKAKDGNGRTFTFGKQDAELVKGHVGQALEIEYGPKNSFDEYPLTSAKVPEPPKAQQAGNGWKRDPEEGKLIVRQSCLKAAVDWLSLPDSRPEYGENPEAFLLRIADRFVAWVYGQVEPAAQEPVRAGSTPSPRRYTTGLREGEDLVTAARRAVEEHDPFEDELAKIPPADAVEFEGPSVRHPIPAARETLRASGPARR